MSTESVAAGGGSTSAALEEAPFSAEQLAWIDRLIAACHSAHAGPPDITVDDATGSHSSSHSAPPNPGKFVLL